MDGALSLQDICLSYIANNFGLWDVQYVKGLPRPLLRLLFRYLKPLDLRRLEVASKTPDEANQDLWLSLYSRHFAIYYRAMFKACQTNEINFCAVQKSDTDYRRRFLEDQFHVLLEEANKINILLHKGVMEVNLSNAILEMAKGHDKANCHDQLYQITSDMMLCAPFVRSLKVFRSKVLMSPLLKDVLDILVQSVLCIRLVFLHDYQVLKETIDYFMKNGKIIDFHTTWQPQRCSLPAKCSVEILTLLAGLQLPPTEPVDEEEKPKEQTVWNPYDLYDIAIAGSRSDTDSAEQPKFECAAVQSARSATHISISSFILTHHLSVHKFVAETLLDRWASLQSLKLACLNQIDIDTFQPAVVNLVKYHRLRQICFEDTQFSNPMDLFISLIRVLIEKEDIKLKKLTMLGIGHPFVGDFSAELSKVHEFYGIENLDLSFSSLNKLSSIPTFCEYLKRDKALKSLNLNCCKLLNGDATGRLLRAVGASTITELVLDFNPMNTAVLEDALIGMLSANQNIESLSCTLCSFNQAFLRGRLLPAIGQMPKLAKLYLAENRIADMPELTEMLIQLLKTRSCLTYLDLSSNFLSGHFLLNMAASLTSGSNRKVLFKGLNLNFNLDRGEVLTNRDLVREKFRRMCQHFFCMILYEDPIDLTRREHMAQM